MTLELLLEMAWKSLACAALVLLAVRLLRRRSAAEKSLVAKLGLLAILLLPIATFVVPDLEFPAPAPVAEAMTQFVPARPAFSESFVAPTAAGSAAAAAGLAYGWRELVLLAWAIPAAILLLLMLASVVRLHLLRARARVLVDPRWLTALAAAQQRLGLKHGTALLTSDEVGSPISWGVIRPIIVLDPHIVRHGDRAEAIIAHELAHVARLDWLALLLGRAVTAIFWFNPVVWWLVREAQDLAEQAADDVVIRGDVPGADYAEVLVGAARRTVAPLQLAANGVAPGRGSLGRRVLAILDPARSRIPVGLGWLLLSLASTTGVAGAVAAADPCLGVDAGLERGRYGRLAAARLADIPTPQTRAISDAITRQDWQVRRAVGDTRFDDRRAVGPLLLALRDVSPMTRQIAAWGLSELRPREAVAPLAGALGDEAAGVRGQAARALGDLGASGHCTDIARLLHDPDADVRLQAAHALGDLRDPAARPGLKRALRDADPRVRAKSAWALTQIAEAEEMTRHYSGSG